LTVAGENFSPAFNPAAFGSERVHKQTRSFYDRRRDREIIVDLYWANSFSAPVWKELPEVIRREAKAGDRETRKICLPHRNRSNSTSPLVVISHGFGADRSFLGYLARHLASHGVTVAAIEHPGSNASRLFAEHLGSSPVGLPGLDPLLPASEFIATPEDVSFLLDRLKS
jgi:predicted dienelactone hydrolase